MSLASLLALVCIILGFISGIADSKIWITTLEWFVAAIAFNTLNLGPRFVVGGSK